MLFQVEGNGLSLTSNMAAALTALEEGIQQKVLRSTAYAGSFTFYKTMLRKVPIDDGDLFRSIYQYHDDKQSSASRQVYAIGPNKQKAPHWYNVEYGHWRYNKFINGIPQRSKSNPRARGPGAHDLPGALKVPVWVPAVPYIRETWIAAYAAANTAMVQRFQERVKDVMKEAAS